MPAQDTEADIVEEVGAEADENGELQAPIENIRKIGAIDAETVRQKRQTSTVAAKIRAGEKASFSTNDPLVKYAGLLEAWPTSTIHVKVRRLSGGPETTDVITSFPRSPTELFEEIKAAHGQCGEAAYEVEFFDATTKEWRGKGKIVMKDTRAPYQGQPPHWSPLNGTPHQGYPSPQAPQQGSPPPGPDPMSMFRQMFELVQSVQPQTQPAPVWAQQPHQPSMPPPPTNPDPASMMKWFQEMFAIVRQAQPAPAPVAHSQTAAPTVPNLPNTPAPPGYVYRWLPESNCCVLEPVNNPRSPMSRDHQRERPPYYAPRGEPHERDQYARERDPYARPNQGPPDPLRESMSTIRRAMALREELDSLLGGGQHNGGQRFDETAAQDPDSPIEVVDTGNGKIIYGRQDGNIRGWDTLLINLPEMFKKGGEYVDKISKTAAAERQRREQTEQQQLPPGYVRVVEGYEPPQGFVAVPMRQTARMREQDLPPPPAHVPPPIEDEPAPQRGWEEP